MMSDFFFSKRLKENGRELPESWTQPAYPALTSLKFKYSVSILSLNWTFSFFKTIDLQQL